MDIHPYALAIPLGFLMTVFLVLVVIPAFIRDIMSRFKRVKCVKCGNIAKYLRSERRCGGNVMDVYPSSYAVYIAKCPNGHETVY